MTSPLHIQLELAGMVDVEGLLGNGRLPMGWALPAEDARLDEAQQRLEWQEPRPDMTREEFEHYWTSRGLPPKIDPAGMLDRFIRIKGADDVLRFARRYGPLRLCEHGMPSWHMPPYLSDEPLPQDAYCKPKGYPDNCSEPVDRWFFYAGQARALLEIGAVLWQGKPGPKAAWKATAVFCDKEEQERWLGLVGESLRRDRLSLARIVNFMWLMPGNVRLHWSWAGEDDEPELWLGQDAFSRLAVQLVSALARAHSIAICDGCSEPYVRPGRKPQAGRRNFCPICGEKVANRLRQRDLRAKRKGEA